MGSYRSRLEIIVDVLSALRDGATKKTRIMHMANLSYELLVRYLKDVMDLGLVGMEGGSTYELTEKGSDFLREFQGYYARRVQAEEHMTRARDEKQTLVSRFLKAKHTSGSENRPGKKDAEAGEP